jgi:Homeodomain-like domain
MICSEWPAPGSEDTELGVLMELEVGHGETEVYPRVQGAVRLIKDRGVSYVQASQDLGVHTSQLRDWVKKFADDPQYAFPGHIVTYQRDDVSGCGAICPIHETVGPGVSASAERIN